ncbi:hypothetical protein MTR67_036078 [Solanum verrucosum]|uniref:Uncharacterized protein n=1 Tax=Solanum verrucosum TaxID=315347 RepID=A0AAF0ZM37_SOLVR|nr:hypothetical protein MTR67_036078 [Solanum verrucosum]
MLACSCGAISLMSNHLENLPDGVIHCLETETVLLQDNNKLKLNSSRYLCRGGSLQEVKMVEVSECPNLKDSLLPPNLIQIKSNLEEVKVTGTSVKAVFGFDGTTVQGSTLARLCSGEISGKQGLVSQWRRQMDKKDGYADMIVQCPDHYIVVYG